VCPKSDLLFEKVLPFAIRKRSSHSGYIKNAIKKGKGTLVNSICRDRVIQIITEGKKSFTVLIYS